MEHQTQFNETNSDWLLSAARRQYYQAWRQHERSGMGSKAAQLEPTAEKTDLICGIRRTSRMEVELIIFVEEDQETCLQVTSFNTAFAHITQCSLPE